MRILVLGGSTAGSSPRWGAAASLLGRRLAEHGHVLVLGGAGAGLPSLAADAALAAGGTVATARVAEPADGVAVLPGGLGTLAALLFAWDDLAAGREPTPIALLDVDGWSTPLLRMVETAVEAGFVSRGAADALGVHTDPDTLLEALAAAPRALEPDATDPVVAVEPINPVDPVDALAWVVVRDGRLLQVRSRDHEVLYLPGGKREPGESDVAALCREVREELGVTLDPTTLTLVTVVTAPAHGHEPGRLVRLTCYAAAPTDDSPEPRPCGEITELRWCAADDRALAAPAGQALMDQLLSRGLMR